MNKIQLLTDNGRLVGIYTSLSSDCNIENKSLGAACNAIPNTLEIGQLVQNNEVASSGICKGGQNRVGMRGNT